MRAKWRSLSLFQRIMLGVQGGLFLLFLLLYATLGRQQVIQYHGALLRRQIDGDTTVYTGALEGERAVFTVSPGPVVEFRLGDALYGPYRIVEDPTAVPAVSDLPIPTDYFTGVELQRDGEALFRGAVYISGGSLIWLVAEDGSYHFSEAAAQGEPSVRNLLRIALAPEPSARGEWAAFLLGAFFCAAGAVSVLWADRLFRFRLRLLTADAGGTSPSPWELYSRWVGWIVLTLAALVFFALGLSGL